jgi:TonB family protein
MRLLIAVVFGIVCCDAQAIPAKDGDLVVLEGDSNAEIVRHTQATVRAVFNPSQHWAVVFLVFTGQHGADSSVEVAYTFQHISADWHITKGWQGVAIVDEYFAPSERGSYEFHGVGIMLPLGLVQLLDIRTQRLFRNPAAVAVGVYRTSSRAGNGHSFDAAEQIEVRSIRQGEQVRGNTTSGAPPRRHPVGVSNNAMPPLPHASPSHSELPLRVGGRTVAPRKIADVTGVTPSRARRAGINGVVILEITVGVDGGVTTTKVLHSVPLLDQAAIDTVRQWRYEPTLVNGSPVPVIMTVTVPFR